MASVKGIPKALHRLAEEGKRFRFPGFWLYDTSRDRIIANWLDWVTNKYSKTPAEEQVNVTEVVKDYLYRLATGVSADPVAQAVDKLTVRVHALENRLASGAIMVAVDGGEDDEIEESEEVASKLLGMED